VLCLWYHKRMMERKRIARTFELVPGEDPDDIDLELGEPRESQENGIICEPTIEQEVENWNEDDWEVEGEPIASEDAAASGEVEEPTVAKKRND